jgi:hypothetical protein
MSGMSQHWLLLHDALQSRVAGSRDLQFVACPTELWVTKHTFPACHLLATEVSTGPARIRFKLAAATNHASDSMVAEGDIHALGDGDELGFAFEDEGEVLDADEVSRRLVDLCLKWSDD